MAISYHNDEMMKGEAHALKVARYYILNNILNYKEKFGARFGKMVIAIDSRNGYWRKDVFPPYKARRKTNKEKSDINWDMVYHCSNTVLDEIKQYLPYQVVEVDKAEADDIIAVLSLETTEFGKYEEVLIVSSDGDNYQLLKHKNIKQYSPILQKQIVKTPKEIHQVYIESVVKGQSGDGYPNIKSTDDHFIREDAGRQKSIKKELLEDFMNRGIEACADEFERKNYLRNVKMYDYNEIDENVKAAILAAYEKPRENKFDRMELLNYLANTRNRLVERVSEF